MRESETIQVLGRGTDVHFTIDDTVPFEVAERSLREYLDICRGLYSKGTVSVNVGRRILHPDQLSTIKEILDRETGLTVTEYWCPKETLNRALAGPESQKALPGAQVLDDTGTGLDTRAPSAVPHEEEPQSDSCAISDEREPVLPEENGQTHLGAQLSLAFLDVEPVSSPPLTDEPPHLHSPVAVPPHEAEPSECDYDDGPVEPAAELVEADENKPAQQGAEDGTELMGREADSRALPDSESSFGLADSSVGPG